MVHSCKDCQVVVEIDSSSDANKCSDYHDPGCYDFDEYDKSWWGDKSWWEDNASSSTCWGGMSLTCWREDDRPLYSCTNCLTCGMLWACAQMSDSKNKLIETCASCCILIFFLPLVLIIWLLGNLFCYPPRKAYKMLRNRAHRGRCCNCAKERGWSAKQYDAKACGHCKSRVERKAEAEKAEKEAAERNNWTCELCGIQGMYGSKDADKCATQRKMGGCCNCAARKKGWGREDYLAQGCQQCRKRDPELLADLEIQRWRSQQRIVSKVGGAKVTPVNDDDDLQALWNAVRTGQVGQVRFLLGRNVSVLCKDGEGRTSLHIAAENKQSEIARMLVDVGGLRLLRATNSFDRTAYDIAEFFRFEPLRTELLAMDKMLVDKEEAISHRRKSAHERCEAMAASYDPSTGVLTKDEYKQTVAAILISDTLSSDRDKKFSVEPTELVCGEFEHAAKGLFRVLQVDEDSMGQFIARGIDAIKDEVAKLNDPVVSENLEYILFHAASEKVYPNGIRDKGHAGMRLADFAQHPHAVTAELRDAEVAALRLYTTAAFKAINEPLRDMQRMEQGRPHPLPVTVTLIVRAIKKLRSVNAGSVEAVSGRVLWRGMRHLVTSDRFSQVGGTELAPMSTTKDIKTAVSYSMSSESLIFRIVTFNALQRGADISWLSAFPTEEEVLYAPLTYLQPTGKRQIVELEGKRFTVVDVQPSTA